MILRITSDRFIKSLICGVTWLISLQSLHAEWGTLSEMHHYRECFSLSSKPAFKVIMLSATAPGNVFHEGDQPQFDFQLENLGNHPLTTTGRVEMIRYAQSSFEGDQWYPDLVRLESYPPTPIIVDLPARGWTNMTIKPNSPETKGGYAMIVDLGSEGRAFLTSFVRTFRPTLERIQYPKQSLEEMPAPILERLGVQAIRWGISFNKQGSPEDRRQWERIRRELKEFHDHKVTVVAEVGAGNHGMPLGRGRPHLDEQGFMQERTKEDLVWLPEFDKDYEDFCYKLVTEFGWPKGPITAIKLWNEPWEGLSISGWGADMLRYRELFKRMGVAVFRARKEAGVDVLIGGCDSSANTIDKLFGDNWDDWMPYLDFCSIHYQGLSAPVLFPQWNNRRHYKGRVLIWDTESWVANADDRFAGVVAANRAAGYDRSMGTLSRIAISTLSHNRVEFDEIRTVDGKKRIERHIESRPLAASYGAVQHLIGEREFREILFTNGLPWVFTFHGLKGNSDDGTVVIVGDLATLFEKGTPLFNNVKSLAETKDIGTSSRQPSARKPMRDAKLVIDTHGQPYTLLDVYGNPIQTRDKRIEVPLSEKGLFLRANPQVKGSFEQLLGALRESRVEGLEPVEIIAFDVVKPIESRPKLRVRITSQHNQPIVGKLKVQIEGLDAIPAMELALSRREQKWVELAISGTPRADNTYPLRATFDAGILGIAIHTEPLHVNWIAKKSIQVDGKLDDWSGTLPQMLRSDAAAERSFEEKMYLPFEKVSPGKTGGLAVGYLAADDRFFYFGAKIADNSPHSGTQRFAAPNEDADFYPEISFAYRDGKKVEHRWPEGVRRFSYRRWPAIPSSMPQASFDNVLIAFNVIPHQEKDWITHLPGRFPGFIWRKTTDYEYALNKVADEYGGGTEIWRLLAPGMPYKHFFPRQPKHPLEGAVTMGQLVIRYDAGWRIVECAIPWSEIPHVKTRRDAGGTVKFNFKINDNMPGPDLMLSMNRSAAEGISHSFHPNWIRQWPNEIEFGFEK